jgi:hypothetical protein
VQNNTENILEFSIFDKALPFMTVGFFFLVCACQDRASNSHLQAERAARKILLSDTYSSPNFSRLDQQTVDQDLGERRRAAWESIQLAFSEIPIHRSPSEKTLQWINIRCVPFLTSKILLGSIRLQRLVRSIMPWCREVGDKVGVQITLLKRCLTALDRTVWDVISIRP